MFKDYAKQWQKYPLFFLRRLDVSISRPSLNQKYESMSGFASVCLQVNWTGSPCLTVKPPLISTAGASAINQLSHINPCISVRLHDKLIVVCFCGKQLGRAHSLI